MEVKIEDRVIADGVGMKLVTVDGTSTPPHIGLVVDGPGRRYNDILNLQTREDDILLVTYPKSGTNWMWEILSMLVRKETTYRKESKIALWLESVPSLKSIENEKSPRVLNTHLPRQWLPKKIIENGGKIIHVMRNPKDVYVSMYHHLKSGGREDMNLSAMTWDQFFDNFVMGKSKISGIPLSFGIDDFHITAVDFTHSKTRHHRIDVTVNCDVVFESWRQN